jgi:tRNA U38,U39,U40 pseudouridine synthase TruA
MFSVLRDLFAALWDVFFGCRHQHYSFPISNKILKQRSPAPGATGSYVVCLDCGKEFAYDWEQMKVVSALRPAATALRGAHSFAVK